MHCDRVHELQYHGRTFHIQVRCITRIKASHHRMYCQRTMTAGSDTSL